MGVRTPKTGAANKHWEALRTSSSLTQTFNRMYRPMAAKVTPEKVITILQKADVRFVLMGTHGVGSWRSEARATQDVDVLIHEKDHAKAIVVLQKGFPKLTLVDALVVTRFKDPKTDKEVIDLRKPVAPLFKRVFRNTIVIENEVRIPNLAMALASKFAAMVSPHRRQSKKLIDAGDFVDIVDTNKNDLDLEKLSGLADLVYSGGGKEVLKLVDDILEGRPIVFEITRAFNH